MPALADRVGFDARLLELLPRPDPLRQSPPEPVQPHHDHCHRASLARQSPCLRQELLVLRPVIALAESTSSYSPPMTQPRSAAYCRHALQLRGQAQPFLRLFVAADPHVEECDGHPTLTAVTVLPCHGPDLLVLAISCPPLPAPEVSCYSLSPDQLDGDPGPVRASALPGGRRAGRRCLPAHGKAAGIMAGSVADAERRSIRASGSSPTRATSGCISLRCVRGSPQIRAHASKQ